MLWGGKYIANQAVYQDYFLFSATTIKGESVGFGLLGNVWVELPDWLDDWDRFPPRA